MLHHHQHPDAILPDDISFLDEILTQLLTERRLGRDCEDAELVAARLISLFQSGVHDRDIAQYGNARRRWENPALVILSRRLQEARGGLALSSWETAVTSCDKVNGFSIIMLFGTPLDVQSTAPCPLI